MEAHDHLCTSRKQVCDEDIKVNLGKTQSFSDTCRALKVGYTFLIPGRIIGGRELILLEASPSY